ncbi:MAG: transglutaminase family protein [Chromatiaceae bacterium]|nr:transglutaminase family protein [Chromatiaceae bacterium]
MRYRDFTPWHGLHPAIRPLGPLHLVLEHPDLPSALQVTLHNWHPQGLPYDGLPATLEDATARRAERLVVSEVPRSDIAQAAAPPIGALHGYTLTCAYAGKAQTTRTTVNTATYARPRSCAGRASSPKK